jgi:hypothetical protein
MDTVLMMLMMLMMLMAATQVHRLDEVLNAWMHE